MTGSRKPLPDADLFAAVLRDVKPLRRTKVSPHPDPVPARESKAAAPAKPLPRAETRPSTPVTPPPPPNPGIDRRTAERLRKGAMEIDRRLDLHGLTEADAHAALDRFVRQAWRDGLRVLLIITGKGSVRDGGGVLRRNLPRWLASGEHGPRVLRIESAQPRHGGSGAYYVLLRRQRDGRAS
ncbi:MAG TPA: Smr/MutS family protein [Alphaproteobacteria bacterium]